MNENASNDVVQTIFTGRRKEAVARVILKKGEGKIIINKCPFEDYFKLLSHREKVLQPFHLTHTLGQFDVKVNVRGGGVTGQAEAVRLGIARALVSYDSNLRKLLKDHGLLTRDPRAKERKKYGRKRARRRFQFTKR